MMSADLGADALVDALLLVVQLAAKALHLSLQRVGAASTRELERPLNELLNPSNT